MTGFARRPPIWAVVLVGVLAGIAPPVASQAGGTASRASTAAAELAVRVLPDTVTVGDSIRAVVRIRLPAGATAEWDDFAPFDTTAVQLLAPPEIVPASLGDGRADPVAVVQLVAWRTGALPPLTGRLRVVDEDGGASTVPVTLTMPHVRSVLPADPAGVRPRGPKDVLGASYDWRRLAVAAAAVLLALLVLAALVRWLVRRRRRGPRRDPRREALRELDALRTANVGDAAFYERLAAMLRAFVAGIGPRWGTELTTTELLERMAEDGVPAEETRPLAEVLMAADLAKFARIQPSADDAARRLAEAREWVARFVVPVEAPTADETMEAEPAMPAEVAR